MLVAACLGDEVAVLPEGFPLAFFAAVQGADVAEGVGARFAPPHARPVPPPPN